MPFLPMSDLSQATVENDPDIPGVRELADEALKCVEFGAIDNDEFHGWVPRASATPMPREIVRKYAARHPVLQGSSYQDC